MGRRDEGTYACLASSPAGEVEERVQVAIQMQMRSKNAMCNMQVLVVEEEELQNGGSGPRPGGDQGWNQGGGSWSGGFSGGQVAN